MQVHDFENPMVSQLTITESLSIFDIRLFLFSTSCSLRTVLAECAVKEFRWCGHRLYKHSEAWWETERTSSHGHIWLMWPLNWQFRAIPSNTIPSHGSELWHPCQCSGVRTSTSVSQPSELAPGYLTWQTICPFVPPKLVELVNLQDSGCSFIGEILFSGLEPAILGTPIGVPYGVQWWGRNSYI